MYPLPRIIGLLIKIPSPETNNLAFCKDLSRAAAYATASVAAREKITKDTEKLVSSLERQQRVNEYWAKLQGERKLLKDIV